MDTLQDKNEMSSVINIYPKFPLEQLGGALMYEKINDHEKRLEELEASNTYVSRILNIDAGRGLEQSHNFYDILSQGKILKEYKQNSKLYEKNENHPTERTLEKITMELDEVEDKKTQIQIVGKLVDAIRDMLRNVPKQSNNYRRKALMMLHQALKQNYTRKVFNKTQIKALTDLAKLCEESLVSREQYFEFDDRLCECDLDMISEWE